MHRVSGCIKIYSARFIGIEFFQGSADNSCECFIIFFLYFSYVDDWFQADGDVDGDGIPNYLDLDFPGRIDSNGDGVDDRFDFDLDGDLDMYLLNHAVHSESSFVWRTKKKY